MVFRPINHPLLNDNLECPHCGDESVTERISLPAYPGDYFDCEACGQSFAPTQEQINRMRCNGDHIPPLSWIQAKNHQGVVFNKTITDVKCI